MLMEATLVSNPDISLQNTSYRSALRAKHATEVSQVIAWDVPRDPQCRIARFSQSEIFYLATLSECCEVFSELSVY